MGILLTAYNYEAAGALAKNDLAALRRVATSGHVEIAQEIGASSPSGWKARIMSINSPLGWERTEKR